MPLLCSSGDMDGTEDQVRRQLRGHVGDRYEAMGFTPKRPVALFNSLSGCVIEAVESERMPQWAAANANALWVDVGKVTAATLGNVTGVGHTSTAKSRQERWRSELMRMMDTDGDGTIDRDELLTFLKNNATLKDDTIVQRVIATAQNKSTMELLKELKTCMPKILSALLQTKHHKEQQEEMQQVAQEIRENPDGVAPQESQQDEIETIPSFTAAKSSARHFQVDQVGSTEFTKHMQLVNGWQDPEGVKVRARPGIAAMECLVANDSLGVMAKLGAALMLPVTNALKELGYVEGTNMRGYGYDWRMPCTKMEERDQYFSTTMADMEDLVKTNHGEKIVVVTHSLGGVTASYFFHWVAHSDYGKQRGGVAWLRQHIHSFVPIGGPLLGTPYGSASYLSGDEGQGLAPMVFSYPDRHLVVRSWGMFGMIFPTGRHLMLQPTRSVHWVRREGVLHLHILSVTMKLEDQVLQKQLGQENKQYYVRIGFRGPGQDVKEKHKLKCTPFKMTTMAAIDEHMQFCWTGHPDTIDDAKLTMTLYRDWIGPLDKTFAKGTFRLGSVDVNVAKGPNKGTTLPGLSPGEFVTYDFKLDDQLFHSGVDVTVTAKLCFAPWDDKELAGDFRRPPDQDPGAYRCGGPADTCTSPEKQKRLKQTLGDIEGAEWQPTAKPVGSPTHTKATYAPMSIDEMMVVDHMENAYKSWKECYNDDPIWKNYSTEPPEGVTRIRPVYGINIPTLVGNVYRHQTKKFVRFQQTSCLKLDTHCEVAHPGYAIKKGIVEEVPHQTPQADDPTVKMDDMTFNTRASGDGTVAYWSLRWPVTWRSRGYTVDPVQVEGAGHRDILEKPECLEAVLSECCSFPIQYVEIWLDSVLYAPPGKCCTCAGCIQCLLCPLLCPLNLLCQTIGVGQDRVFVEMNWRDQPFVTETLIAQGCCGQNERPVRWCRRFVLGVTQKDLDDDRPLAMSVCRPIQANISKGGTADSTQVVMLPISQLARKNQETPEVLPLDGGAGKSFVKWHWQWYSAGDWGTPDFRRRIQK